MRKEFMGEFSQKKLIISIGTQIGDVKFPIHLPPFLKQMMAFKDKDKIKITFEWLEK